MHRADAACPTCGERQGPVAAWSGARPQILAAAGMLAIVGIGWQLSQSRMDGNDARGRGTAALVASAQGSSIVDSDPDVSDPPQSTVVPTDMATIGSTSDPTRSAVEAPTTQLVSDSVRWVPVVARTWVNVRSDASRAGPVVGVIKPAARALLGTNRAGWRLIKAPDVSGWVDPRLFEPDSLQGRGD